MEKSTCLSAARLASLLALPDSEKVCVTRAVISRSDSLEWLLVNALDGSSGKTFPASCPATKDGTLAPSSGRWLNSGMGSPTECLTLNTSEFHSGADVSLLSHILEVQPVPPRFYLSVTACKGILRRAEKRKKKLPEMLYQALMQVTADCTEPADKTSTTDTHTLSPEPSPDSPEWDQGRTKPEPISSSLDVKPSGSTRCRTRPSVRLKGAITSDE